MLSDIPRWRGKCLNKAAKRFIQAKGSDPSQHWFERPARTYTVGSVRCPMNTAADAAMVLVRADALALPNEHGSGRCKSLGPSGTLGPVLGITATLSDIARWPGKCLTIATKLLYSSKGVGPFPTL